MLQLNQIIVEKGHEGQQVVAGQDAVALVSSEVKSALYVDKMDYNDKRGTLIITRENGEVYTIGGLPTAAMISPGRPGPKGFRGLPGREGRNGRDGAPGKKGCVGPDGEQGLIGPDGEDGEDGPQGPEGEQGYTGQRGERGDGGADGPVGPWGPDGEPGSDCVRGPTGPTGPAPVEVAVVSKAEPVDPAVFFWLYPSATATPVPVLPTVQPVAASVSNMTLVSVRQSTNSDIFVIDSYLPVNVRGGKGPFTYKWKVLEPEKLLDVILEDDDTQEVRVKFARRLGTEIREIFSGLIECTVTDEGQQRRPTAKATSTVTIVAHNPHVKASGCIVSGSIVHTPSGPVMVQDLKVGQMIMGLTGQPENFRQWTASGIHGIQGWATVTSIVPAVENSYYIINGQGFTHEQPILILAGPIWSYLPARDVRQGQTTIGNDGALVLIREAREVKDAQTVFDITVSSLFCYFVGNSLTHNLDYEARLEKI